MPSTLYTPGLTALPSPSVDGSQLTYAASMVIDMGGEPVQEVNITGNLSLTLSGISEQKKIDLIVRADGSTRNLTFPAGWVFVGTKPTTIAASKAGRLTLLSNGNADADVIAQWSVQT